jgi:hypothetical protein
MLAPLAKAFAEWTKKAFPSLKHWNESSKGGFALFETKSTKAIFVASLAVFASFKASVDGSRVEKQVSAQHLMSDATSSLDLLARAVRSEESRTGTTRVLAREPAPSDGWIERGKLSDCPHDISFLRHSIALRCGGIVPVIRSHVICIPQ